MTFLLIRGPLFSFFAACSAFAPACDFSISVLTSPLTPSAVSHSFQQLQSELHCEIDFPLVTSIEDLDSLKKSQSTIYVDVLYHEFLSVSFTELICGSGLQVLSGNLYSLSKEHNLYFSLKAELAALIAVAESLSLTRFSLFLPTATSSHLSLLDSKPGLDVMVEFISEDATLESLKLIVHKLVAHFGFATFLMVVSASSVEKLIIATKEWTSAHQGLQVLISSQGAYYMMGNSEIGEKDGTRGAVFIVREGCQTVNSPAQLLLCEIRKALSGSAFTAFAIMNMRRKAPVVVGSVSNAIANITSAILSNADQQSALSYQTLTISFNNGTLNPSGEADQGEYFDYIGVQFAFKAINDDPNVLPYHNLQIFNVSLGLYEFDYNWALSQISKFTREDLGVAMLCGEYSGVVVRVYSMLAKLGYELPQIGSANTAPLLSSIAQFPLFARVTMSDRYLSVLYAQIIKHYEWKRIAIVYANDTWSTALYNLIFTEIQQFNVTVANAEDTRMLQPSPSQSSLMTAFQEIVTSQCRVVILILPTGSLLAGLAILYDLGMRRGDILFLATEWLDKSLFEQDDADMRMKISELCNGAIQFYPASLVGDIGQSVRAAYEATGDHRTPTLYGCFYYDAAYLLAHALDYLIMRGTDYKSASNLMKSIRNTRFRGCSGIVSLDQGTNDRSPIPYSIWNARVDSEGGNTIVLVGTYNPMGLVLFNFTDEIVWPDGSSIVPTDTRGMFEKCPFDEKDARFSVPAVIMMTSIIFGLSLILIFVTSFIWMKRWNFSANPLQTRAEVSFDDYYVFGTIAVDALQYATMGPLTEEWSHTISYITGLFTAQMESVMDMSKGQFWTVLIITYSVVGLWAMLFFAKKTSVFQRVRVLLPLIGNLGFLPVISILLSVFQCLKTARGTGLQSTFLSQDCFQNCWVPPHVFYAASSTLCLFLFVPAAVLLRPTWQDSAESLHIHTSPSYLMVKTIYEMTIVAFQNTVKKYNQITHVVLFLIITIAFCGYTIVRKPFGYERANLWHTLSLVGVLWFALLSLITSQVTIGNALTWLGIFGLGNLCIITFGAIWQCVKLPSLLYRKEEVRLFELFKFMFSGRRSYIYLFTRSNRGDNSRDDQPAEKREFTFALPIVSSFIM